jgi:predicted MFS family arabinose efflux permease
LAVSAFNAGIAAGSWLAGHALDSSLGATGPALVGVAMTAVGLVSLLALVAVPATGTDVSDGSLPRPVAAAGAARPPMP